MSPNLEQVSAEADALLLKILEQGGDLAPAFAALEKAIPIFEGAGYQLDELIPATAPAGIGFRKREARTGKGFWEIYSQAVRKTLCAKKSKLRVAIDSGTGSLVTFVMTTLTLPLAAAVIIAPIVAILMSIGVDAYCQWSDESTNER